MKTWTRFLILLVVLVILDVIISSAIDRAERHERAELHMLDSIKAGVLQHLYGGGQLPTNWMSLSNSVNWELVAGISEYNHLPPPEESYTVLARAITNEKTGGFYFLLSSKPTKWPARRIGRWALIAWPTPQTSSDYPVRRIWVSEDSLKPEIRSQLTNHP